MEILMDKRLDVKDAPRQLAVGIAADLPLVAIAWRALRTEHQRRAAETQRNAAEMTLFRDALANVAELVFRLRRVSDRWEPQQMLVFLERLEQAVTRAGISVFAPEGEEFTSELMDVVENVAQQVDPRASEPRVGEIIEPAVLYHGDVLRMGKAVIRIPGRTE